jgi:oligo-alginate lyase
VKAKMMVVLFLLSLSSPVLCDERPALFLSQTEANDIKASVAQYPLFAKTFRAMQSRIDLARTQPIEVPMPGEGGGYEHERHKQNYNEMRDAGFLFRITGEEKYAVFVREMLNEYAELYPTLGAHPFSSSRRGPHSKLFHQALNESVWLVNTSQAYDCIYDWLSESDRKKFEQKIFRPMVDWFVVENERDINRIHNHGTWAVAAVGMMGYLLKDQEVVDKCLYGTNNDGTGGFLKQLDLLFSPDGYYMEGPYYARYAIRPFYLFAEAIERFQPEVKIYEHRDQILKKAFYATAQTTFPNGVFPPINDASKSMNITAPGPLIATNIVYYRYGADPNLLAIAQMQDEVIIHSAGLAVAKDYSNLAEKPELNWGSVEFTDGHDGKQGGLGILRMGKGMDETMLLMKYGVRGGGHGHSDKLHFILFDQGHEVVPDYGFGRWVNVEPKSGGRYLPENNSYAKQTIAHNTVVVDQKSQAGGRRGNRGRRGGAGRGAGIGRGDGAGQEGAAARGTGGGRGGRGQRGGGVGQGELFAERHFFETASETVQAMSARADKHYPGVKMQRTMFLIKDERLAYPVVLDLYRVSSDTVHTYDYPIHFQGQLITTNFEYEANTEVRKTKGTDDGYQHIWEEATATTDKPVSVTWVEGNRFYSLISSEEVGTNVWFGRSGANDPNFNLRSEPMVVLRRQAESHLFASVIEPHGYYLEAAEKSLNARPNIASVKVIGHNDNGSVVEVLGTNGLKWQIMVNNGTASKDKRHAVEFQGTKFEWTGNYKVDLQ